MARVVLYSNGYRGDVLPFVPVARELVRRGHSVRFVCPREFHPMFDTEPFTCIHTGTDLGPDLLDQHAAFVARWGRRFGGAMLPRLYLDQLTIPFMDTFFDVIDQELETADVLLSHPFPHLIGGPAAERRGIPALVLDVFPMLRPSRHMALPGSPPLPDALNAAGWRFLRSRPMQFFPTFRHIRRFRARLGLSVDGWNFFDACTSDRATIGLFSEHYQPRLPDWPSTYRIAGFTPWLGSEDATLPADVDAFLDAGEPPVVVTLGTNAASARPDAFTTVANALSKAGVRGLLLTSREDIAAKAVVAIGKEHGVWPFVALGPLLGRCRAVVHAGGHGTNAAVFRAGLPAAIEPAVTDQAWHAKRITELGLGIEITTRNLDNAIDRLVNDDLLYANASRFADLIRNENGAANAADIVDEVLA